VGEGILEVVQGHAAQDALAMGSMISPPSTSAPSAMPSMAAVVLGDDASCATSTRRGQVAGVGGLEGRVGEALRAPCVEMKYCSTVSPSRKFAVMGVSMISPEGFAISPRMPAAGDLLRGTAGARVGHDEDGLKLGCFFSLPSFFTDSVPISAIISPATAR